jgi:hypothetical protein
MNDSDQFIPPVVGAAPTGSCFCGCDEAPKPGKFFVQTHDRKAESRVIRERFGNIATFVAWAEAHVPAHASERTGMEPPRDSATPTVPAPPP